MSNPHKIPARPDIEAVVNLFRQEIEKLEKENAQLKQDKEHAEEKVKAMEIVRNFLLRKLHLYGARLCPSYGGWSGKLGGQASVSCDYEHMYCGNRRDCSISLGGPGHDIEYEVLFADVPPEQAALIDQLFKLAKKDTATKEIKELKGVQETLTQKIDELSVVEAGWTAEELAAVLHDEDNGDQRCDGSSNCV